LFRSFPAAPGEADEGMKWGTRLGNLGTRLGLLLGSTGFAVLLIEGTLRWVVPTIVQSPYHCVWPPHLRAVFNPDPAIMPGVHGQSLFVTNSRGLRGEEMPEEPSYGILAVGGSTTESLFLDQAETWPQLLQKRLSEAAPPQPVWVGNAGRSGLSTRDHVVQLKYLLPELPSIDAIIFLIGVNDLTLRNLQDSDYDPYFMTREGTEGELLPRAFGVYPLQNPALSWQRRTAVWQLARDVTRRLQATGRDYQDQAGRNYVRWRAERRNATRIRETMPDLKTALEEYSRNVNRLIDLAQERAIRPIFLTQPTIWRRDLSPELMALLWVGKIGKQDEGGHEYYSVAVLADEMEMYNETLATTCRSRQVECFDLASRIPKDGTVFYDDDHYTEKGSELVADVVARFMRERSPFHEPVSGS
jgi:lysophospholipase L1-like esterase